jgi:uncharacterized protein involved in cysteine biosynthesis
VIGRGFTDGARDVGAGLRFLRAHPRLWRYVIAPALVTLALIAVAIAGVLAAADPVVDAIAGGLPDAIAGGAPGRGGALPVLGLGFAAILLFVPLVGVVADPFNERLAAAVLTVRTGVARPTVGVAALVRDALVGLLRGLGRVLGAIVGAVLLFALSLVPVIGTIAAAVIAGWLTARGTARDCYEAALGARALDRPAIRAFLARHRQRALGLGAAVAGLLVIPGVNLIALGVGIAGATLAALELDADPAPAGPPP